MLANEHLSFATIDFSVFNQVKHKSITLGILIHSSASASCLYSVLVKMIIVGF